MLTFISGAAQLTLAALFGFAGTAKLADRPGTRLAMAEFGLPPAAVAPASLFVPAGEVVVAGAVLLPPTARWGALGAAALLVVFSVAVLAALTRNRRPDCRCFGQLRSTPIGAPTLRRNALLGGLAIVVVWSGPGMETGSIAELSGGERAALGGLVVLGSVVVLEGWAIVNLLRAQGRLLLRLDAVEALVGEQPGLPVGTSAPAFSYADPAGENTSLELLLGDGRPVLLVFTDPSCRPCQALRPDLARWRRDYAGTVTVAVVSQGDDRRVAEAYQTTATPSAVLIGRDGRIRSPVAAGGAAIRNLLMRAPEMTDVPDTDTPTERELALAGTTRRGAT
ncbi:MAG: MauE/DoxX family redox-associated membrane protein [Acidimicrobiia bacterium]